MKILVNAFLILAAGAAAYFSLNQSQKFTSIQSERLELKEKEGGVATEATAAEKEARDEQTALNETTQKRDSVVQAISALKATESSLKRDLAKVEQDLATQAQDLADLNKAVEDVNKTLVDLDGAVNLDNIGDQYATMEKNLKERKERQEELATLIDAAQKKVSSTRSEAQRLSDRAIESSVRISRNAMEAVVTAVNQDWGFLVIGAGSNSGFTPQTSLLVKRDGKMIGRVKPTSIEATQTIADIELDSLAAGVRIQPGDRVILATPAAN